ncbi:hypothetical protein [Methanobrevibacter sp. YE315]|uniref:hypothetical protein n=1 Tax=Methanobrevibacter sp. YE315 TaxID=1609968 RepID=UPI0012DDE522|nr:hypothetical protein [Methanobrevibacter sp. YE315]
MLIFLIGSVSAVNPDDFTTPEGFKSMGKANDGSYNFQNNNSQNLNIYNWNGLKNIWFGNYDMHTCEYYDNNIYVYTDAGYCGYQELIEKDGNTYLIVSFLRTNDVSSVPTELYDNLIEFNKLNKVEPTPV